MPVVAVLVEKWLWKKDEDAQMGLQQDMKCLCSLRGTRIWEPMGQTTKHQHFLNVTLQRHSAELFHTIKHTQNHVWNKQQQEKKQWKEHVTEGFWQNNIVTKSRMQHLANYFTFVEMLKEDNNIKRTLLQNQWENSPAYKKQGVQNRQKQTFCKDGVTNHRSAGQVSEDGMDVLGPFA